MTMCSRAASFHRARLGWPVLAWLAAAPAALAGTPIEERATADPAGQVEVSNTAGSVVITAWPRNEVEVTGTLGEGTERLEFSSSGKLTRVKVVLPQQSSRVQGTNLVLKVPAGSGLAVNTVSADVSAAGVRGSQRLQSVSGNILTEAAAEDVECKSVSGDVAVNTVSANVTATGVRGSQRLQSVSGYIHTEAAAEDVECKTVSGNVKVKGSGQPGLLTVTTVSGDADLSRVAGEVNGNTVSGNFAVAMGDTTRSRLRSTSGDLGLRGRLAPDARLDFESISGNVRLDLQGPVGAEFDVSSFNGDIRNCFGPQPVRSSEYAPGRELRFREGAGTGRVRIKTLNGDISVCNK
jgi:DUF4097 and DUF4098 domain-containing protein YvlB